MITFSAVGRFNNVSDSFKIEGGMGCLSEEEGTALRVGLEVGEETRGTKLERRETIAFFFTSREVVQPIDN